jgi:hypothetical protein
MPYLSGENIVVYIDLLAVRPAIISKVLLPPNEVGRIAKYVTEEEGQKKR